jgi:hypothetical protein
MLATQLQLWHVCSIACRLLYEHPDALAEATAG